VVHLPRPPVAPLASVWVADFDKAAAERFARGVANSVSRSLAVCRARPGQ
jgi:hypothetical protein